MIRKILPFLCFVIITGIFFWQFLFKGLLPIPADTIVGLYNPYRDLFAQEYPNGIPFKNFLITDPVRQQYPWRNLSVSGIKSKELPIWNPYSFSGTPNLANSQSAAFYPLNILFVIFPFEIVWSFLILLEPLLGGIFMFWYLRNLRLDNFSSFFGGVIFSFSGFFTTWLEWGTVLHAALWLPLILLSIDKILININKNKKLLMWSLILVFSTVSSFFAGHLQTFFYLSLVGAIYILVRLWQSKSKKFAGALFVTWLVTLVIVSIQLIPSLRFILLSARDTDQLFWQKEGWFIPWQHLIQFLVPDFFGNPSTLNYWGTWNYGELTGYVGMLPLIVALYALIFRKDRKTLFFGSLLFVSLIFSLPTLFAKLPFFLSIPFISTAQPTRLIFLIDFSMSILAALGLNYLIKTKKWKEIFLPIGVVGIFLLILFGIVQLGQQLGIDVEDLGVAKRNMILPLLLFISSLLLIAAFLKFDKRYKSYLLILFIIITIFDLFRFSWKFNTFSKKEYLFPSTSSIDFVKAHVGDYRIATTDPRILAPNFSSVYKIQSVEGYDPLFLNRYGEFVSAINRNEPNIKPPFGFNRIVRIENFSSDLIDLMGVKYVLSLSEMTDPGFVKVYEEGQTKVYENKQVLPRVFFVDEVKFAKNKQEAISLMFNKSFDPGRTAIVENNIDKINFEKGEAKIVKYSENVVEIQTENDSEGFLILTDSNYPSWHVRINNQETKIYRTDYNFRGIKVPKGSNRIIFYDKIL